MFKRGIKGLILRFSGALVNFILTVFIAKNMVKEEFGSYQLIITLIVGISLLSRVGMDTFLLSTIPGENIKKKINFFFQQSIYLVFQCSIVLLAFLAAAYSLYQYLIKNGFGLGFGFGHGIEQNIIVFIAVIPQSIYLLISAFEKASGNSNNSLFLSSVSFPFFMLIILLIEQNFSLTHITKMYLVSSVIVMLTSFLITSKKIIRFKGSYFKPRYSFFFLQKGLKYLPHSLITFALLWLDILIIGAMLEGNWTADYSVASRVTLIILLAMSVYDALVSPQIIKSFKKNTIVDFINEIKGFFYKTIIFISFFVIIMVFLSEHIITLFGDQYSSALDCAYILIAAYGVKSLASLPGYALIAMNKIHIVNKILIGAVILNTILNLILITDYKIIGVAIGTLVTSIFIVILSYIGMLKNFKQLKIKNAL
ncbi:MAG: polysaccharide biosynthesis C-terminal domain-containing protein [Methylococcales bacterium]|nr:polysaccharide biosynthesis C-terminal domain-containing protein [Methylococcales bacterium]